MSDYPPVPPYGANYGSQPQTSPSYLQPTYPNQYMQPQQDDGRATQSHMASNYDTSISAYGYNNSIPGFSASSLPSAAPPLPIYQGWNQDVVPLPSYSTPHSNMQYTGYGGNSYQNQQSYPPPQPQTYHQNTQHVAPYDEGELSEGEFDAYGGQQTGGTATSGYGSNYYQGNDGTGYMSTAHRAVYPSGQDYTNNNQQYSGNDYNNFPREPPQAARQQSDSYSPYAGVNAGPQDYQQSWTHNSGPETSSQPNGSVAPLVKDKSLTSIERLPERTSAVHNGQNGTTNPSVVQVKSITEPVSRTPPPEDKKAFPSPPISQRTPAIQTGFPKSVAEARKKAEGAILNLWPYEVRYPNYVEEGLDEAIVGSLFDSLGFARTPLKAAIPLAEAESTFEKRRGISNENVAPESLQVDEQSNIAVGEEGRGILLENNGNRVPPKTEPTEKEKNLKLKMEALRKSREERAQKAAAKTQPPIATAPLPESSIAPTITDSLTTSTLTSIQETAPPSTSPPSTVQPVLLPQSIPSSQPVIPGLFLASTSSPAPLTSYNPMFGVPPNNQRKRPVAADFDNSTSTMSYKRPFGQTRNDSLVIDVSEEEPDSEDEDVAMELDSQADQDSPVQAARKTSDQRTAALQNLPPLTNFPTRKPFASPTSSSVASTPPVHAVSKAALGHPQVLQQKETEIELLKKKIAEAEAAKAAKRRAQQTSSGAATPQLQSANGASGPVNGNGDIASKVEASIQMQQLIGIAEDKVSSDQKRLAETQAAELEKAAEVKHNEAESRRLRREKIATDLPRVDAEVEQSQLKLQQLREEMARIEAAVQKSMDDKRRMAEEMERLGQEAEDQLQEQKDKLKDLTGDGTAVTPPKEALPATESGLEQAAQPRGTILATSPAELGQEVALPEDPATNGIPHRSNPLKPVESSEASDHALEIALQEQVRAEAESHEQSEEDMDMDVEDSYAPDLAQSAPDAIVEDFSAIPTTQVQVSEKNIQHDSTIPASQVPAGANGVFSTQLPNVQSNTVIEMEDDDYEPPEATPPIDTDMPSPKASPPFSPAPPESITEFEQFSHGRREIEEADAGELQVNGSVPHLVEGNTETSNQTQSFTPYESPLKFFRAFRFHPDYKQEVSGGLKSMTYSHKIDPNTEFCRYELAGGVCNDKSCEFQHFRDIALPEDSILSALGSPEEFPADQQQKFREGLRQVLTGLRARKVRDFDTIAAEVVSHRSKFLGDPSKVLMLEGTNI